MPAGVRWFDEIGKALEGTDFGIICVTPENVGNPWLNFEAGAIGKRLGEARVVPYLIGMRKSDLPTALPLSQFNARRADREDTLRVMQTINDLLDEKVEPARLERAFSSNWMRLETAIEESLGRGPAEQPPDRGIEGRLDDIQNQLKRLNRLLTPRKPKLARAKLSRGGQDPAKIPVMRFESDEVAGVTADQLRSILSSSTGDAGIDDDEDD